MNFESAEFYDIKDYKDLYNYIKERVINKKNFIFYLTKYKILKNGKKLLILF